MKTFHFSLAALALLTFSGALSAQSQNLEIKPVSDRTFQLVKSHNGNSFDTGRYNFHARAQQANGLYRGVMIYSRAKDPKLPENSIAAYASFARRDKTVANRWILGNVVLLTYDKTGNYQKQKIVKRLVLDIT